MPFSRALSQLWRAIQIFGLFIRAPEFSYTFILPFLGAATVTSRLTVRQIGGLLAVAFAYHCYTYILNDLIDLPLDRALPRKAYYPLVNGSITPRQAMGVVLAQLPLALIGALWAGAGAGGNLPALTTLGVSFGLMTLYNLGSKYTPAPPLTDLAQGVAWATLALYGALLPGAPLTPLTMLVCVFQVVMLLLFNGVHSSLRDVPTDLSGGVVSTAILLGARPDEHGGLIIPRRLEWYAFLLHLILAALILLPVLRNDFGFGPAGWGLTLVGVVGALAFSTYHLLAARAVAHTSRNYTALLDAGTRHAIPLMSVQLIFLSGYAELGLVVFLLTLYFAVMLFPPNAWLVDSFRRGRAQRAAP